MGKHGVYQHIVLAFLKTPIPYAYPYGLGKLSELIFENTLRKPFQEHALRNSSEIISAVATKSTIVISGLIRPTMALITYGFMLGAIITFLLYLYTFETSFILIH